LPVFPVGLDPHSLSLYAWNGKFESNNERILTLINKAHRKWNTLRSDKILIRKIWGLINDQWASESKTRNSSQRDCRRRGAEGIKALSQKVVS
jgi:hypothetical protein